MIKGHFFMPEVLCKVIAPLLNVNDFVLQKLMLTFAI